MSYILDALKKATTEREHQHGNIPDLSAQPARGQLKHDSASKAGVLPGKWLMTAAVILAASVVIAFFWRVLFQSAPVQALPLNAPAERVIVTAPSAPSPPLNPSAAVAVAAVPTMPPPLPSVLSKSSDLAPTANVPRTQRASANIPPIASLASTTNTQKFSYPSLPDTAPKLLVSGSTYSENAAHRILIVNGQMLREGESPATGIKIEKIGARAAVLQYEGTLFSLRY